MARQYSIGFETNTLTNGVEANSVTVTQGGGLSIQTGTVRTGTYALKVAPTAGGTDIFQVQNSNSHSQYIRFYFNKSANVTGVDNSVCLLADSNNAVIFAYIFTNTNGTLGLAYGDTSGGFTQIGSNSSVLALNTWYLVELHVDDTGGLGSTVCEARLNGVVFATGTESILTTGNGGVPNGFTLIGDQVLGNNATGTWFIDDLAINDSSGTNQNGYPGIGAITRITPNAAGDANSWATQTGGTAGSANNFTRVNETTPNDATSFNGSTVLSQQDLFKCIDPSIGTDTVNCVQVMARYRNNTVDLTTAFEIQCEKDRKSVV